MDVPVCLCFTEKLPAVLLEAWQPGGVSVHQSEGQRDRLHLCQSLWNSSPHLPPPSEQIWRLAVRGQRVDRVRNVWQCVVWGPLQNFTEPRVPYYTLCTTNLQRSTITITYKTNHLKEFISLLAFASEFRCQTHKTYFPSNSGISWHSHTISIQLY